MNAKLKQLYRVKYGLIGSCRSSVCCHCCHSCHGLKRGDCLYVYVRKKGVDYDELNKLSGCTGCDSIKRSQLIPVNTKKERARYLLSKL